VNTPKPTSVKTEAEKLSAKDEYNAEQQAALDRMEEQRRSRLTAGQLIRMKNRP
jgi:hypothetical protein